MYLDILTDPAKPDEGETLHIRLKGISNDAITEKGSVKDLYKTLFETETVFEFDLSAYKKF